MRQTARDHSSDLPAHLQIGPWTRAFYFVACSAAFVLLAAFAVKIESGPGLTWQSLLAIPAGIACADFVSGMVHWSADTWGSESMPVLGKRLLHPFRVHHVNPGDFLKRRFVDTNGDVAFLMILVLGAAWSMPMESPSQTFWAVFVLSLTAVGLMTNQIHQWAHMRRAPWLVRMLQRTGVILSYRAHRLHHQRPHTANYCIATGWCNAPLQAVQFFSVMEYLVSACTGLQPRSDEHAFTEAVSREGGDR